MSNAALDRKQSVDDCWRGFNPGSWRTSIDVRDFIVSQRHILRR